MVALREHGARVFLGIIAILVTRTVGASPSAAWGPQLGLTLTCSVLRPCPQPLSFRSPFICREPRKATVPKASTASRDGAQPGTPLPAPQRLPLLSDPEESGARESRTRKNLITCHFYK